MATRVLSSPPLWLGSFEDSFQVGTTYSRALSAVFSSNQTPRGTGPLPPSWQTVSFHHARISDQVQSDLLALLDEAIEWLLSYDANDGVEQQTLVHCQHGVSRSAAICIAFSFHCGMSLADSVALITSARPAVHPNQGFWTQLCLLEQLRSTGIPGVANGHLSTAPVIRMMKAGVARYASGRSVSGWDDHSNHGSMGLFVSGPDWSPRRVDESELQALRERAEAHVAKAKASIGTPDQPPTIAQLLSDDDGGPQKEISCERAPSWWHCCGRCNARVAHSRHVVYEGHVTVLQEGRAQQHHHYGSYASTSSSTATDSGASETSVLCEPMGWMAAGLGGAGEGTDDPRGASQPPAASPAGRTILNYARVASPDEIDDMVPVDGGKLCCPNPRCGARLGSWAWTAVYTVHVSPSSVVPAPRYDAGGSSGGTAGGGALSTVPVMLSSPLFRIPVSRLIKRPCSVA